MNAAEERVARRTEKNAFAIGPNAKNAVELLKVYDSCYFFHWIRIAFRVRVALSTRGDCRTTFTQFAACAQAQLLISIVHIGRTFSSIVFARRTDAEERGQIQSSRKRHLMHLRHAERSHNMCLKLVFSVTL